MKVSKQRSIYQWIVILTGVVIGVLASLLQYTGNPKNMGLCIACMERDIVGALGLHRAAVVQNMRPEIPGIVLGALIAALLFREFRCRTGSAPVVRFLLGFFGMAGALVFLGCPWRALLRLAGGDWNAILGLAGLAVGIGIGVLFLRAGYDLGRSTLSKGLTGWVFPTMMGALLILSITRTQFADGGPIFTSAEGPGSMYAPIAVSLAAGLLIGFLAQRSRFCTVGSFRDVFLMGDSYLMKGVIAFVLVAAAMNLLLGQFKPGFADQPVAHTMHLWNFAGMVLAGLAFTLAGGCPARQLILSGEGDADAAVLVLGMFCGAGVCHNLAAASSPAGVGAFGALTVGIGLLICLTIGFAMVERSWK